MSDELKPLTLAEVERQIITAAVERMDPLEAAKVLGVGKTTIYRKLREYELNPRGVRKQIMCMPEIARLLKASWQAAHFLDKCTGSTAPTLAKDLQAALAPFVSGE